MNICFVDSQQNYLHSSKTEKNESKKYKIKLCIWTLLHCVPKIVALITVSANTGACAYVGHNSWHMR